MEYFVYENLKEIKLQKTLQLQKLDFISEILWDMNFSFAAAKFSPFS